jgi:hypothetical protein
MHTPLARLRCKGSERTIGLGIKSEHSTTCDASAGFVPWYSVRVTTEELHSVK